MIEYNTLSEYLFLLRGVAESLAPHGPSIMLYLAAAVSDFYVPSQNMVSLKSYSASPVKSCYLEALVYNGDNGSGDVKKNSRLNKQNNNFAHAEHFFVHLFAVPADCNVKSAYAMTYVGCKQMTTNFSFSL